jgi:AMP-activated protein kinase-like protein
MKAANEITRISRAFKCQSGISLPMIRINVRFIVTRPLKLQINHSMKTLDSIQNEPVFSAPVHLASPAGGFASAEDSALARSTRTAFSELMLHPEQLAAALNLARIENEAFDAARVFSRSISQRAMRTTPSSPDLKLTEFHLAAPFAESVKLAADFTDWEKFPLDLIKSQDGVWYTDVPLPPGQYGYRFIVDGQWRDDPHPAQLAPNPFGTVNAVMKVA